MAALFETRNDTINLWRLAKDMKAANMLLSKAAAEVDALLREATPVASKVTILRSNLFAHRSDSVSYASAFELAQVTPDQLHNLTEIALKIANQLLLAKGLRDQFVHPGPHEHAGALLQALLKNQCPR
jgi:AbiU2